MLVTLPYYEFGAFPKIEFSKFCTGQLQNYKLYLVVDAMFQCKRENIVLSIRIMLLIFQVHRTIFLPLKNYGFGRGEKRKYFCHFGR